MQSAEGAGLHLSVLLLLVRSPRQAAEERIENILTWCRGALTLVLSQQTLD